MCINDNKKRIKLLLIIIGAITLAAVFIVVIGAVLLSKMCGRNSRQQSSDALSPDASETIGSDTGEVYVREGIYVTLADMNRTEINQTVPNL